MSGSSYISVLPTLIKNTIKKELYDIYITDSLRVIGENTAKYAGGSYIKKRWISFIEDNPQKEQTGEEQLLETAVYAELLKKVFTSVNTEIAEWEKQDYERCPKYPEQLIHPIFNGQKVRSKSEAIIATMLHVNRIPFHYEEALHLGKRVIYPDFTIRHPVTGQTYYWEHFGMMDNENYAQAAFQKMQLYNINGIMLSDTLLATYESEEVPLKSNIVENMIQQYFL